MSEIRGLVLAPDDLVAARRTAHEALVLAVAELDGAAGAAADRGRERVMARAGAVRALGTETDGDDLLVLVDSEQLAVLLDGARHVVEDLGVSPPSPDAGPRGRHAGTVGAARRVRDILADGA